MLAAVYCICCISYFLCGYVLIVGLLQTIHLLTVPISLLKCKSILTCSREGGVFLKNTLDWIYVKLSAEGGLQDFHMCHVYL